MIGRQEDNNKGELCLPLRMGGGQRGSKGEEEMRDKPEGKDLAKQTKLN
jgi:hypothetical protein